MTPSLSLCRQINIAKCHGMALLPNEDGIMLSDKEVGIVERAAQEVWHPFPRA